MWSVFYLFYVQSVENDNFVDNNVTFMEWHTNAFLFYDI